MAFRFTLDTCCVIAMVKPDQRGTPQEEVAAIARLIDLAREGRIDLQLSAAYDRDFDRYKTADDRRRQIEWLESAPIAGERAAGLFIIGVSVLGGPDVISSEEDSAMYDSIRAVIDPGFDGAALADASPEDLAKRTSDADHLIAHTRSDADAFVTIDDRTILKHRDALAGLNVSVIWPTEAVSLFESDLS